MNCLFNDTDFRSLFALRALSAFHRYDCSVNSRTVIRRSVQWQNHRDSFDLDSFDNFSMAVEYKSKWIFVEKSFPTSQRLVSAITARQGTGALSSRTTKASGLFYFEINRDDLIIIVWTDIASHEDVRRKHFLFLIDSSSRQTYLAARWTKKKTETSWRRRFSPALKNKVNWPLTLSSLDE